MNLFRSDNDDELFKTGFSEEYDFLDRKEPASRLSALVENIDDPLVIALDGPWGSGKSFFLKGWVGEHGKNKAHISKVVYFDAFKHDFIDDPLLSIVETVGNEIDKEKGQNPNLVKAWAKAKKYAPALTRSALRVGISLATAGVINRADEQFETLLTAGGEELEKSADQFWRTETAKRQRLADFKEALQEMTNPDDKKKPTQKLVIIVDELDRCRPDFALNVLETIKHLFDVPGVHFVLGVNIAQLANSVRARYGTGTDAVRYVEKFVSLQINLPTSDRNVNDESLKLKYFRKAVGITGLDNEVVNDTLTYLKMIQDDDRISFRSIKSLVSEISLLTSVISPKMRGIKTCVVGLLLLRRLSPVDYKLLQKSKLDFDSIRDLFGNFQIRDSYNTKIHQHLSDLWLYLLEADKMSEDDKTRAAKRFDSWGDIEPINTLQYCFSLLEEYQVISREQAG